MMTIADIKPRTVFRFVTDPHTDYEKIGDTHYRKGIGQISNVCLPTTDEPIFVPHGAD